MTLQDIAKIRLFNHQIVNSRLGSVKEVVGWMGAMQAQDAAMVKWAVGARLPHATEESVEMALNNGDILRTHLLRPTWHLVSPDDIHWMLELSANRIKASMKARDTQLGLTPDIFAKSKAILEELLQGGKHLTKEEMVPELNRASIATDENRAYHLLMHAELDGLICNGQTRRSSPTYRLLSDVAPKTRPFSKEEALGLLAQKYFTSHGPATLPDFTWWSGLSVGESKLALEMNKPELCSVTIEKQTYWYKALPNEPAFDHDLVHVLPAFDEFLISYKDRSATLVLKDFNKVVSSNGIFRPFILINGQVAGIWRRVSKKDRIVIETTPFKPFSKKTKNLIEETFTDFERFSAKKVETIFR
jgi:hypothetical protein